MKKNINLYQKKIRENIESIEKQLKNLEIEDEIPIDIYRNALKESAKQVTAKWSSGRKYCRTLFVQNAFGDLYPDKYTELSLFVDAMVNILDDFFDEELGKEVKGLYILEYLKLFSLFNFSEHSNRLKDDLGVYFNKLITLALAEDFYEKRIAKSNDLGDIVSDSAKLLLCRGMDIDIFTRIALLDSRAKDSNDNLLKLARIFRALNIFKKDIKDLEHDRANGIQTVTVTVEDKGIDYKEYSKSLIENFHEEIGKLKKPRAERLKEPFEKFKKMIKKEEKEILNLLK